LSRSSVISKYGSLSVDGANAILDEISSTTWKIGADGKKKMPSYVYLLFSASIRTTVD
jgi:hypothetical protein